MTCQCWFVNYNKCNTLGEGNVDREGGCARVEAGNIWELSLLSPQSFCEPNIPLKKKILLMQKRREGRS